LNWVAFASTSANHLAALILPAASVSTSRQTQCRWAARHRATASASRRGRRRHARALPTAWRLQRRPAAARASRGDGCGINSPPKTRGCICPPADPRHRIAGQGAAAGTGDSWLAAAGGGTALAACLRGDPPHPGAGRNGCAVLRCASAARLCSRCPPEPARGTGAPSGRERRGLQPDGDKP
jgi:hypothetical protein